MSKTKTEIFNETLCSMRHKYPITVKDRKFLGSVPPALHAEIKEMSEKERVTTSVIVAVLLAYWNDNGAKT